MEKDKEFLEFLVKAIVDHPDDVHVERRMDDKGTLLTLKVNPADMGQVIGKGGDTANKMIRPLLNILGRKHNVKLSLRIEEPEGRSTSPDQPAEGASE